MTVIFDGDCGICSESLALAQRALKAPVTFAPYQAYAAEHLARLGLSPELCSEAMYTLDGDGRLHAGVDAWRRLMLSCRGWLRLVGLAMGFAPVHRLAAAIYRLVARHRVKISTFLGLRACRVSN
jgi:predicted DCC family thiol-disulfide oxidoreductase YuxK